MSAAKQPHSQITNTSINTERFKLNAVMIILIHLRDNIYDTRRKKSHSVIERQSNHFATTATVTDNNRICTNPAFKNPTNSDKLWQRLD